MLLVPLVFLGCAGAGRDSAPVRVAVSDGWPAMGTLFEADLRVRPEQVEDARAWIEWARREIPRLERIYSRHDAESALSHLNRSLAEDDIREQGVRVDAELEAILFSAVEVWEGSGGAFDVTIGPLVDVWSQAAARGVWPSLSDLRRAKQRVDGGGLLLPGEGTLIVTAERMRIDLDGISKGEVLDCLRARLRADLPGIAALIGFGQSSLYAIGDPDPGREGWRLALRSRSPGRPDLGVVRVRDRALSASSSVGSVSVIEGQQISHVIDPRTGSAVEGAVESVVIANRAALADGWSTALLVLGASRTSEQLIERAPVEALVIDASGRTVRSAGWEAFEVTTGE